MTNRRIASTAAALIVAAIAAYASYSHMRHLALRYGQDQAVATLLPISVDGLMVVATIALGDGRRHRWSAWIAFWSGVLASVVANVLAAQPSAVARTISAWPAIAFLLVVEVITRGARGRLEQVAAATDRPVTDLPAPVTDPVTEQSATDRPVTDDRPTEPVDDELLRDLARDAYRDSVLFSRPMTGAALARKFGIANPRWGLRRIAEVKAEQPTSPVNGHVPDLEGIRP